MAGGTAVHAGQSTWHLDPAHSSVEFSVKHMMMTTVRGRFKTVNATLTGDESHPEVVASRSSSMSPASTPASAIGMRTFAVRTSSTARTTPRSTSRALASKASSTGRAIDSRPSET
jgi:hypothetical protein